MVMFLCKSVDYNNRSGTQRRDAENIFERRTKIHSETDKKKNNNNIGIRSMGTLRGIL